MAIDKEIETETEVVSDTQSNSDSSFSYNGVMDTDDEHECIVNVVSMVSEFYYDTWVHKEPKHTMDCTKAMYTRSLLEGHDDRLYELCRMDKDVFIRLCNTLKECSLIANSGDISVEEQLAIFLHIVGHNERNRMMQERFEHSDETISCFFNDMLMNCIGAIDGTHISAWVPTDKQTPYWHRKGPCTQNVMAACDFNMRFTLVLAGWEGTANDYRIFADAMRKYYVVDFAYPNIAGYMAPYRNTRYHLLDFRRGGQPTTKEEYFNNAHASLRSVIKRSFSVLKAQFPILKCTPCYPLKTQRLMVVACMAIHNFIRDNQDKDTLFNEFENDEEIEIQHLSETNGEGFNEVAIDDVVQQQEMLLLRQQLADAIYADQNRPPLRRRRST
ncbi:PREDICTED: uncharacterized protein LOC104594398 [Nelumbo nucifera]|uniref:Uncharacterized protein LOC104594398 n=1 Tax=Nelumbo nucifera TaxID=4432 RepID=A0A1U7ZGV5_NELNU|nr:PREDICTED: uncharacterized protein LOC104594398 [Nelumbo nucifera]